MDKREMIQLIPQLQHVWRHLVVNMKYYANVYCG